MMLPLPTVPEIDVTAERLKDVERDRTRPLPNIAGTTVDALKAGAAAQEMGAVEEKREEAKRFQTEYVDKGWEGAEKFWKENGADASMNPAYWRTAVGDTPAKWFEMVGKKATEDLKKKEESARRETASKIFDNPKIAEAVRIGALDGKDALAELGRAKRSEAAITSREKIAKEREATQRARTAVMKLKDGATSEQVKALDEFVREIDDAQKAVDAILAAYPGQYDEISEADQSRLTTLRGKIATANSNAGILRRKGAKPNSTTPKPPKVGEIRSGYEFKGGDPADQKNWKKVQ